MVVKHCDGKKLKKHGRQFCTEWGSRSINAPLQDSQEIWLKLYPIACPPQMTHVKSALRFLIVEFPFDDGEI